MIESRHKQKFINDALQFDSNTSLNGRIAKIALEIAENGKESAVIELCNIVSSNFVSADFRKMRTDSFQKSRTTRFRKIRVVR